MCRLLSVPQTSYVPIYSPLKDVFLDVNFDVLYGRPSEVQLVKLFRYLALESCCTACQISLSEFLTM